MNHDIIVKGNFKDARLAVIKNTVKIFEECIEQHPDKKPTCDQILYVRDIKFLLHLKEQPNDRQA